MNTTCQQSSCKPVKKCNALSQTGNVSVYQGKLSKRFIQPGTWQHSLPPITRENETSDP